MNTFSGKIYLKESVLDEGRSDYIGGNMMAIDVEEIYIFRDGITFKYRGREYFVPHSNVRMIRKEEHV